MSRRYICHGCERAALSKKAREQAAEAALGEAAAATPPPPPPRADPAEQYTFMGYDARSTCRLPYGWGDEVPCFFTRKSAVDYEIIDDIRPMFNKGVRPESYSDILLEQHTKEHMRQLKKRENEIERKRKSAAVTGYVVPELFGEFGDKKGYAGLVPTGAYIELVYKRYMRSIVEHLHNEVGYSPSGARCWGGGNARILGGGGAADGRACQRRTRKWRDRRERNQRRRDHCRRRLRRDGRRDRRRWSARPSDDAPRRGSVFARRKVKKRGAEELYWDVSYKEPKHLGRYHSEPVYKGLVTATNQLGEVRSVRVHVRVFGARPKRTITSSPSSSVITAAHAQTHGRFASSFTSCRTATTSSTDSSRTWSTRWSNMGKNLPRLVEYHREGFRNLILRYHI